MLDAIPACGSEALTVSVFFTSLLTLLFHYQTVVGYIECVNTEEKTLSFSLCDRVKRLYFHSGA